MLVSGRVTKILIKNGAANSKASGDDEKEIIIVTWIRFVTNSWESARAGDGDLKTSSVEMDM